MSDRKTPQEMVGEFVREASVLVLVFGWLEAAFHEPVVPLPVWYTGVLILSLVLLSWGMRLERRR